MWCHGGVLSHFSWTNARVSRIELSLWKMMSSIILSPEHPQNDEWSELLGKTQILPEKMIQEWRWIVNHIVVECCIFVLWSHLILERNMSFLCLFVVLKSRNASFKGYFDKNIFFFYQTPTYKIKASQSWRLKVFWLRKWLDAWK